MSFSGNFTRSSASMISSSFEQNSILKWIVRIVGFSLIVFGAFGNTLSAMTLIRRRLRAQVTSIYLFALAISDLGNVLFSVLNFYLIRLNPNHNIRLYSNLTCKLHMFFTYYFINLSPTLLVAVSVQRYLTVAKHQYSRRFNTMRNAYWTIGSICLLSLILQLHWPIFYERNSSPISNRSVCNVSSSYPRYIWFRSNVLGYLQWFFFTLCPFVIMLILNCSILKVVSSASRIQKRLSQKNQRKRAKQRNMSIMLLAVTCIFIVLTAPASTFMAFGHLFRNLHGRRFQSIWTIFSLIYYANTAANFLLYVLTANIFRQEMRRLFFSFGFCRKSEENSIGQQTSVTLRHGKNSRIVTFSNRNPSICSNNLQSKLLSPFDSHSNRRSSENDSSL